MFTPTSSATPSANGAAPLQLTIHKTAPEVVQAGTPITYILTVKNEGLTTTSSFTIRDTLPTGANLIAAPGGHLVNVTASQPRVEWPMAPLPPSNSRQVQLIVAAAHSLINADYDLILPNAARVAGAMPVLTIISQDITTSTLNPQTGGVLNSTDGNLQINFPANALTVPITVTLTNADQLSALAGFSGIAFSLTAVDNRGNSVKQFVQPFTLTLHYTDTDWQNAGIGQESDLNLYFWNGAAWVLIPPCSACHDLVANTLTVQLDHLTLFALRTFTNQLFLPVINR